MKPALEVARWEFNRFYKLKDQLRTLAWFAAVYLIVSVVTSRFGPAEAVPPPGLVELAVVNRSSLPLDVPRGLGLVLRDAPTEEVAELRERVASGELAGLLILDEEARAELVIEGHPPWLPLLELTLLESLRRAELLALDLPPDVKARVLTPPDVVVHDPLPVSAAAPPPAGAGTKLVAAFFVVLMLLAVFLSISYLFMGVTGEKSQRVTEQVLAAITPQAWMDGKLLGITAVGFANVLAYLVMGLLFAVAQWSYGSGWQPPRLAADPWLLGLFALFALLGVLLWNCVFAVVAATVDDPHTSSRSVLVFLPIVPLALALPALGDADGALMRVLALLPGASSTALPARLVLGHVQPWEVVTSLALLIGAIAGLRRLAGKVFGTAILMTGKEPTWGEVVRWMRYA